MFVRSRQTQRNSPDTAELYAVLRSQTIEKCASCRCSRPRGVDILKLAITAHIPQFNSGFTRCGVSAITILRKRRATEWSCVAGRAMSRPGDAQKIGASFGNAEFLHTAFRGTLALLAFVGRMAEAAAVLVQREKSMKAYLAPLERCGCGCGSVGLQPSNDQLRNFQLQLSDRHLDLMLLKPSMRRSYTNWTTCSSENVPRPGFLDCRHS